MFIRKSWIVSVVAVGIGAAALSGCGGAKTGPSGTAPKSVEAAAAENPDQEGWWCKEHGVPEGICALCSAEVAADFKKKGDWCKEHSRPESQCFICHPEFAEKFAARYEAKFGQKPPDREE
jgi:hypothetical protein